MGSNRSILRQEIVQAFDPPQLRQTLLEGSPPREFDMFVSYTADFGQQVFQLIERSEKEGWLQELIDRLLSVRAGNIRFVRTVQPIAASLAKTHSLDGHPNDRAPSHNIARERIGKPQALGIDRALLNEAVTLSNIPIRMPIHFMGRDEAIADVERTFARAKSGASIMTLHGMRGVGKTTLAAAYAERRRAEYRATWWIRAQTESSMRADLVSLGVRLGWLEAEDKEETALARVLERLRDEGERILLIYDNAIDVKSVEPYIPISGQARVLITSNAHAWRKVAELIEVRVWPATTGADYLIASTGRINEREAAAALSEALDGLPLGLEQAAAYCDDLSVNFSEYQRRFKMAAMKFLADEEHASVLYRNKTTVAATFNLGIEEAAKRHPGAEPLIVATSMVALEPIPLFLFAEGREQLGEPLVSAITDDGLDLAVAALRTFALLDRDTIIDERQPTHSSEVIRLHRLVREVAAARRTGEEREGMHHALIRTMATIYPTNLRHPKTWPRARLLDPHALALVNSDNAQTHEAPDQVAYLLAMLARYRHWALWAFVEARLLCERALQIRDKVLGSEHPDTASSLSDLADLYWSERNFGKAYEFCTRALAIREKVLGLDHPDTLTSRNDLAGLLEAQSQLGKARVLYQEILTARQKVLGPEHPDTATTLHDLAHLLEEQGNLVEAKMLFERALAIREKALDPEHPDTARTLDALAALLRTSGDFVGARSLNERALVIREKGHGSGHPVTAIGLAHLASTLKAQGDLSGARRLFERVLAIDEKQFGSETQIISADLTNLGVTVKAQADLSEARSIFERALEIDEKVLGPLHQNIARDLVNLGATFRDQGDLSASRRLLERALEIDEKVLGPEHPQIATVLAHLGFTLKAQGDLSEARRLFERTLAIDEKALGTEHKDIVTDLVNLASTLQAECEFAAARPLFERAIAINDKLFGPEYLYSATVISKLASLLYAQRDLDAARRLYERALAISERTLGEHPNTATFLNNVAVILKEQGDLAGAKPLYQRALAVRKKLLGAEHPETAVIESHLADLLYAEGDVAAARLLHEHALAINESTLGPDHPETAKNLNDLAAIRQAQGDMAGAKPLYLRALAIREKLHDPNTTT